MRSLGRALFVLLLVPTLAGASAIALEAARLLPSLSSPPSLDEAETAEEFALAAWCAYLAGADTRGLLAQLQDAPSPEEGEAAAALFELRGLLHQGLGEYEESFHHFARLVHLQPDRPESLVYLRRLVETAGEFPGGKAELERLCRALLDEAAADPAVRAQAGYALVDLLRAGGFPAGATEATRLAHDLGWMRFFSFLGPFDNTGEAGLDTLYGPEADGRIDLDATYPGKRVEVGWRPFPQPSFALDGEPGLPAGWGGEGALRPFYGPLSLSTVVRPNSQVCGYLASWVRVEERSEVVFSLGAVGAFKLWLDGALVLSREGYRSWAHPDTDRAGVILEPGWHEVLLKTCCDAGGWEVFLRTTNRAGGPLPLEHSALPPRGWRRPAAGPETFTPEPDPYARLQPLAEEGSVLALYYLGHLEARERRARIDERLHRELFHRALTGSRAFGGPDSDEARPWAPAAHSYALYETAFNPAKNAFAECLKFDPRHVESLLGLARSYALLQRPREVLAYTASGLQENPACLPLLVEEARQLALLEYQIERKAVLDRIFELHPEYRSAEEELAAYGRDRADLLERARLYGDILERDAADAGAAGRLTDLYLELGLFEEARRLLSSSRPLEPYSLWSYEKEARLLFDRGDYAAAARVLSRALELCPEEAELLGLYGCALHELGLEVESEAAWKKALDIQPNLTWLTDYRRSLAVGTASDNFDQPYAHDVYALIDAFEPLDPDASAEVLLDQEIVKVNADGTVSRVVHKVVMLKTEDALSDFGWGYFSYVPGSETYEVRQMRVIRADSTELEATDFREYSSSDPEARMYTGSVTRYAPMPGLEPGAVIDISYQIDEVGENIFQGHFSRTFVFGDYQPVHLAEFILIAPTGYRLYHKGAGGAAEPVVTQNGRERAYAFTLRDIPRLKPEPSAPPPIENLPYVAVSSFADWRELGRWWWQLAKETFLDTPLVRELAERLVSETGARTTLEKIAAGYDYVTKSLRYVAILLGIGGWKPIEPESTVHTGYGDCKASAALLVSLYRAMGIRAYPVLVRTRDRGRVEWDQAGLSLFNHMICAVPFQGDFTLEEVDDRLPFTIQERFGDYLFLDGTTDFNTWWELPSGDQGLEVYICTADGGHFAETPLYAAGDNYIYSRTRLALAPDGNAQGHRELDYGARLSPDRRADNQQVEMQEIDLEVYWNRRYPGTDVYNVDITDPADTDSSVSYAYDLTIPGLARRDGDTLIFATHLHQDLLAQRYGSLTERRFPLRFDYRWLANTRTVFELPPGIRPLSLPEAQEMSLETSAGEPLASMFVSYEFSDGALIVSDEIRIDAAQVSVADYAAFRGFLAAYERIQAQVVLVGPGL